MTCKCGHSRTAGVQLKVSHGARGYASCLQCDRGNVCKIGIRLNADFILCICEVCWTDLLLGQRCKSRHGPDVLLRDSFHETFTHDVSIKWHNRKHLVLTQRSKLSIKTATKKGNSDTKQTSDNHLKSADRILGRTPWCCRPHYDIVQSGIDCKLAHFDDTQKHSWTIHFKHTSSCGCCGAFYVYSIERGGTDDLLVVTRYQDLSDIAVYASILHLQHRPVSSMDRNPNDPDFPTATPGYFAVPGYFSANKDLADILGPRTIGLPAYLEHRCYKIKRRASHLSSDIVRVCNDVQSAWTAAVLKTGNHIKSAWTASVLKTKSKIPKVRLRNPIVVESDSHN